jgi:hypothetical protein
MLRLENTDVLTCMIPVVVRPDDRTDAFQRYAMLSQDVGDVLWDIDLPVVLCDYARHYSL